MQHAFIIDDSDGARMIYRAALEDAGFAVGEAIDGFEPAAFAGPAAGRAPS
jgi:hypothetical protein